MPDRPIGSPGRWRAWTAAAIGFVAASLVCLRPADLPGPLHGAAPIAGGVIAGLCVLGLLLSAGRRAAGLVRRAVALEDEVAAQRAIFEHLPLGAAVIRVGADGQFLHEALTTAFADTLGCIRHAAIGQPIHAVWPEPLMQEVAPRIASCLAWRRRDRFSARQHENEPTRRLEIDLVPLPDRGDAPRRVLACLRDVAMPPAPLPEAASRTAPQADPAELAVALFRNSDDILFVVRVEGDGAAFVYESFSPSLETKTGWRAEDLVGRGPDETLPAAAAKIVLATYRRCVAARTTITFTTTYDTPFGRRDYEGSLTPVQATGLTVRLVGALRDVTERNLMQSALHHAQKMESIGRLAAGVAHDFNNILQSIFSLEMMLVEGAPDGSVAEFASVAFGAAQRGADLTSHLLSYARKQVLQPRAIELPGLLAGIDRLLARTLGPHISVAVSVAAGTPAVTADPTQLETALLNLAINAAHAMKQGGALAIEAGEVIEDGRRWAAITVTDNGTGMDEATLACATDPFFTTKGLEGTGLGLSMVQGFAEQSGGRLSITSKLGVGTSVRMFLPGVAVAAAAPDAAPSAPAPAGQAARRPARILLVDDDPGVLTTIAAFLRAEGFGVLPMATAPEALAVLAGEGLIDALVTDYAMPGMSGAELITRARALRPALPGVVISGFVDIGDPAVQADGIITLKKPFRRAAVVEAVCRVLDRPVAGAGSPPFSPAEKPLHCPQRQ